MKCVNSLKNCINKWNRKHIFLFVISWTLIIAVLLMLFFAWQTNLDIFVDVQNRNIDHLNSAFLIIFTLLLVCISWIQLSEINRVSRSDFLTRIIDHMSSDSMNQAFITIHKLRLTAERKYAVNSIKAYNEISNNILNLRYDEESIAEFIRLKSFLDFLECIAYLCNKGYISEDEINEFLGASFAIYYMYFRKLIREYRSRNKSFYFEFRLLIKKQPSMNKFKKIIL